MILVALGALIAATIIGLLLRSLWVSKGWNIRATVVTLAVALFVIVVAALAATGRLNWIAAAFAMAVPFVRRLGGLVRFVPWLASLLSGTRGHSTRGNSGAPGAGSGRSTTTESPFIRMTLHHASGHMDGEVKQGRYQGRFLSELTSAELLGFLSEVTDYDSKRLLETYLDHHDPDWRANGRNRSGPNGPDMTRGEALEALGLAEGASRDDIVTAHRRLIQKLHPDRGGSTYLAALLNRAKDTLIKDP